VRPAVAALLAALLAAWFSPCGHAFVLQTHLSSHLMQRKTSGGEVPSRADTEAKWDNMDEFLRVMFTMACKWKHGKDIQGLKAHEMRKNGLSAKEGLEIERDLQTQGLAGLAKACGAIVAQGKGKCRQGCADRWGKVAQQRDACDEKCVISYGRFESRCKGQVSNLEKVYAMKQTLAQARTQCYRGHCAKFPTVWTKVDKASMQDELGERCEGHCIANQVKVRCEKKWQLEVDFLRDGIRTQCHEEGLVAACFKGNQTTLSTKHDTCVSEGKATCDAQFVACQAGNQKGGIAASEDFCGRRKTMCLEQVSKHCSDEHGRALTKAKAGCEEYGAEALVICMEDRLNQREAQEVQQCIDATTPKCNEDCKRACDVTQMSSCLANLRSQLDPAQEFCEGFWTLLHHSAEVDPVTGDPIVLLSDAAIAEFTNSSI